MPLGDAPGIDQPPPQPVGADRSRGGAAPGRSEGLELVVGHLVPVARIRIVRIVKDGHELPDCAKGSVVGSTSTKLLFLFPRKYTRPRFGPAPNGCRPCFRHRPPHGGEYSIVDIVLRAGGSSVTILPASEIRRHAVAYAEARTASIGCGPNLGWCISGETRTTIRAGRTHDRAFCAIGQFRGRLYDPDDSDPSHRTRWPTTAPPLRPARARHRDFGQPRRAAVEAGQYQGHHQGAFRNSSLIKFDGLYYLGGQNLQWHDGSWRTVLRRAGHEGILSPDFEHWSPGRALAFYRSDYLEKPLHMGQEVIWGQPLHRGT